MKLKSYFFNLLLAGMCVILFSGGCADNKLPIVGITQIASHPSLDAVRRGIIKGLEDEGFVDGKTVKIIFKNANGDPSLTLPIAQDLIRQGASVLVPITTPSALGAAKSTSRIPVVFAGVTDPAGIGLVSDLNAPGGNITGTSDRWPFKEQLIFFKEILPQVEKIGFLYKPGDDVSKVAVKDIQKLGPLLGFKIIIHAVSRSAEVYPSAVSLLRDVDALYTGLDSLIVENLDSVLKAAKEAGKPVLAGDVGSVERGALASYSLSMFDLGIESGRMVAKVLQGNAPGNMPVKIVTGGNKILNRIAASKFPIDLNAAQKSGVILK